MRSEFFALFQEVEKVLREGLAHTGIIFVSTLARFVYLVQIHKPDKFIKRCCIHAFTIYDKYENDDYKFKELDLLFARLLLQTVTNIFKGENQIDLLTSSDMQKIKAEIEKFTDDVTETAKLDCYLKKVEKIVKPDKHTLFKVLVLDANANEFMVYLWINDGFEVRNLHYRFDFIEDFFALNKKISFYQLSLSEKGFYYQNPRTFFVLEPDFLVDVTAISECFLKNHVQPELFFLKFIRNTEFNKAIIKGNFINYLLDLLFQKKKISVESDFKDFLKKQKLKAFLLTPEEINDIITETKALHTQNLLKAYELYKDNVVSLEPSFITSEYGLQGRLDALIESKEDQNRKDIFELKSGEPPNEGFWQNNYAQVIGYIIMLKSVYGENRTGENNILYSQAKDFFLRDVASSFRASKKFLMCRNVIVNKLFKLANMEMTLYDIIKEINHFKLPPFYFHPISQFLELYKRVQSFERVYLNTMITFIMSEMIAKKIGYFDSSGTFKHGQASLWNLSLSEKVSQKIVIPELNFVSEQDGTFLFSFEDSDAHDMIGNNFREGDILLIYPYIKTERTVTKENTNFFAIFFKDKAKKVTKEIHYHTDPTKTPVFRATLKSITQTHISINFRNELISIEQIQQYDKFVAEHDMMDATAYNLPATIIDFLKINDTKKKCILGESKPRMKSTNLNIPMTYERILTKAENFQDYLLLQGPPGTGKTSKYLIAIVKQHLKQHNTPMVILAYTHRAVDEICQRLTENELSYILLGSRSNVDFQKKEEVLNSKIFLSTVANFQTDSQYLSKLIQLDLLIVDEASQVLEHQLLGIIALFLKFILIGDHYQLPAISLTQLAVPAELTETIGMRSLSDSLFERLYERCVQQGWEEGYDLLPEHYRMHSDIADLINENYGGKLKIVTDRQKKELDIYKAPEPTNELKYSDILTNRVLYFPTKYNFTNKYNKEEADKVYSIVDFIHKNLKLDLNENTIGVICTWRMQVNLITQRLSNLPYASLITVDTVERFQGSERDIIIYSTAIANAELLRQMQSLTSDGQIDRKLNVAISRAREQFILLGYKDVLEKAEHYSKLIIEN